MHQLTMKYKKLRVDTSKKTVYSFLFSVFSSNAKS